MSASDRNTRSLVRSPSTETPSTRYTCRVSAAPSLRFITPADPLYVQEIDLRYRVLRAPLGLSRGSEIFPFENDSLHLVAVRDDRTGDDRDGDDRDGGDRDGGDPVIGERVVGCVLFHPEGENGGRLLQMAVEESLRGRGLGSRLVRALETALVDRGYTGVYLHARTNVAPFYRSLGYLERGLPFEELGIPHVEMWRALDVDTEPREEATPDVDGAEDNK